MGRITLGRSVAQFSCKLSCNPDLWNPRESRVDGKSREAVEVNAKLDNLLLAVQSSYQSLLAKGLPFDATDIKEDRQTRARLQQFIQAKYKVSDLAFSQLTEDFIQQFEQYVTGEVGLK